MTLIYLILVLLIQSMGFGLYCSRLGEKKEIYYGVEGAIFYLVLVIFTVYVLWINIK